MNQQTIKPTDAELEILQILWDKETASVREVHNVIATTKNVGYTTTLKLMQIMFEKGIVARDDRAKVHIYRPLINKNDTLNNILDRMAKALYGNKRSELIKQAIHSNNITKEELNEIRSLIDTQLQHKSDAVETEQPTQSENPN